ncbi:MAG: glycosyltransferase family 4 protein [Patescibacteria group bacterium]
MTKKSKILYVITKSIWGGAQKYVYDLATGLPKDRFEVFVAAGGRDKLAQKITGANIPYLEIRHFQRDISFFKEILAYFEILKILLKIRPDIVHVNSSKAGLLAGSASFDYRFLTFNFKLKTIFTAHGWAFHESRPKWQIWLIKLLSRITCFYYSRIICISEYDYQSAIKNKICSKRKLVIIHNGIKPEEYSFLERTEKRFTVGTIGEDVKNKGHKYLLDATKNFPNINCNIISNLSDAAKYLKNFDIFVLPSLKEGLPYVLLEAGLAEIPIIATNVSGVPEIIEDPSTGSGQATGLLINPASSEEITNAIKKLINNPDLGKTLAKNCRQKILKEFSFERMVKETIDVYNLKI